MIDTSAIRNRLMHLAVCGNLIEQNLEEGKASELVAKLSWEINNSPRQDIAPDEVPYEIPENWSWCRLSDIGSTNIGLTYHPEDVVTEGVPVLRSNNIKNNKIVFNDLVKVNCEIREKQYINENDILICARNGSKALVGKCAIYCGELGPTSFGAFMAVYRTICFEYVYFYFQTKVFRRYFENENNKQINQVTQSILKDALIPLPPMEEQKRIVKKLKESFALLEEIDNFQEAYNFDVEILRNKLIDAGIKGKLTVQLSEDGTAEDLYEDIQKEKAKLIKEKKIKKEKALAEVLEEELPFDIPNSWKWVRLEEISNRIWAGGDKPDDFSKEATEDLRVPVVANGVTDDGILGYTRIAKAPAETITVAGRGTIGFCVYRDYEYCPIVRLIVVEPANGIDPRYLKFVMQAMQERSVGSSIPQLTVPMIKPKLIPLPPYQEQKRIVNRLETLLEFI